MARWPNAQFFDDSIYNLDFWAESDVTLDSNGIMNDISFPEDLASSGINAQGYSHSKCWILENLGSANNFSYNWK